MDSRQRLQAVFNNQVPDRLPIWIMMPFTYESYSADVYSEPSYSELVKIARKKTDFIDRSSINNGDITHNILFHHPELKISTYETPDGEKKKEIKYKDVILNKTIVRSASNTSDNSGAYDNYVSNIDDLDKVMSLPYEMPEIDLLKKKEKLAQVGNAGISCVLIEDAFSMFHHIVKEEDACIYAFTDTFKIKRFLDFILERQLAYYRQLLENNIGEVFFISGSEYLCEPLGPPKIFKELITPYNKALVDLIRSYGKKSILHTHGRIKSILGEILSINPDALHPIEPSPMGDVSIKEVRETLGQDIVLIGNIEYSDLSTLDETVIEKQVEKAIRESGKRNFILAPTCATYEKTLPKKTLKNYISMINAGIKYGKLDRVNVQ